MVGTGITKKFKLLFAAAFLLLIFLGTYPADAAEGVVYDEAGLLREEEIASLNDTLTAFAHRSGWNIYAVTTEDAQQKQAQAYADDFFDEHSPEQEDGTVLLIDMDNREIALSTCGIAIRYLTDNRIDIILDEAYDKISREDYAGCLQSMFLGVQDAYNAGILDNQYNYDEQTGEISEYRGISRAEALVSFAVAACAGVFVFGGIVGSYKLKFGGYSYDARQYGSVNLSGQEDRFVNRTETHRKIQTNSTHSSSSGQSTTHSSSSGRSHGGGSRKF